jgi:hypothetical protein
LSSDVERIKMLEELERSISQLTAGQYSRTEMTDNEDFNSALGAGIRAARRLRTERHWLTQEVRRLRRALNLIGRN